MGSAANPQTRARDSRGNPGGTGSSEKLDFVDASSNNYFASPGFESLLFMLTLVANAVESKQTQDSERRVQLHIAKSCVFGLPRLD